ncbi:hypothetical protein [Olivibacter jilunii]|uniref:hypothetical protein n=1 Tax=Olivibacter jilunii TaxID=985016 RepID=UPI0010320693|nr:hypothetical protein [Olivibacter jilunii]
MRKSMFKSAVIVASALLMVVIGKAREKSRGENNRRVSAWYKTTGSSACGGPELAPGNCVGWNTGIVCTVSGRTWYSDANCVAVMYRLP